MSQPPMKSGPQAAGAAHSHVMGLSSLFGAQPDVCCAPRAAPSPPLVLAPPRRTRLAEIDANIHCSIVGTCLTTAELRKLIPRYVPALDRQRATDLEIHHAAVELTTAGGPVAKELNKALDTRHALAIKRFKAAADAPALAELWRAALASGDVPGAYWALMTHPLATIDLRTDAFGDVHMLSHLVGASNRADLRRLVALEQENADLKEQNERLLARLQELAQQQQQAVQQLEQQGVQLARQRGQPAAASTDQLALLRTSLHEREQELALHAARRAELEQRLLEQQAGAREQQVELAALRLDGAAARAEIQAVEQALVQSQSQFQEMAGPGPLQLLDGQCVLYVGGRPGSTAVLGRLVAAAGGELLVHDGGIEDRSGLLDAMLPRARLVVFPVDCVSHNAMHNVKRACERHGIAWHALRSASVASFVELVARLTLQSQLQAEAQAVLQEQARRTPPVLHFCLRHG